MPTTSVVFSTCLLPDSASIQSTPEKISIEPKNSSASDEAEYPAVNSDWEDTFKLTAAQPRIETSYTPLSAKPNNPIAKSTSISSGGASLLHHFTSWAGQNNIKISISARRAYKKVLQFLEDSKSDSTVTEIYGVGPAEYTVIEQFCEDFGLKPRLTYIDSQCSIFLEMPSGLHEAPMATIQSAFHNFFRDIPYPKRGMINVNFLTNIEQDDAIPDLRISIQNVRDRQLTLIIPAIGESAFSQHLAPLYFKLKTAVAANPALLMVIVAVVQELRPYFSPERHSTAYNVLLNEPRRSWDDFHLSADGGDPALDRPIVVEGHTWASLRSVRFKVWLRGAQAIDIDSVDPNLVADGSLFPTDNDMTTVLSMVNMGAEAIREQLIELCRSMVPAMNLAPLRDPSIRFHLEIDDFVDSLLGGMAETAYGRYRKWHKTTPRPKKRKRTIHRAGVHEDAPAFNTRARKRQR
ncbi:hypothetical protein EDD22DRAFT_950615 [Suillus occidentalis]|nr:hypothetical protein EDD22DRAFT_950615 [Suillus occidentalis]